MNHSDQRTQYRWLVAYTYPNFEKKVKAALLRQNIGCFLPLQKVVRQWSDRKKEVEVPLFANYIFVYTSSLQQHYVLEVPGVSRYVTSEDKPVAVPAAVIEAIQTLIPGPALAAEPLLEKGDRVRITEGPFTGLEGVLFEQKGKTRFAVEIRAISQSVSIEICTSCVQKIE